MEGGVDCFFLPACLEASGTVTDALDHFGLACLVAPLFTVTWLSAQAPQINHTTQNMSHPLDRPLTSIVSFLRPDGAMIDLVLADATREATPAEEAT